MKEPQIVKLRVPVLVGAATFDTITVRRLVPADRPVIARAIRAERQRVGRPLSAERTGAIAISTICGIPIRVARRMHPTDIKSLYRMIGQGLTEWLR